MGLPVLSDVGELTDPNMIMVQLYQYFLASLEAQSSYFKITSAKYIIGLKEPGFELENDFRLALENLFSKYFENVTVEASLIDKDDNNNFSMNINIIGYKDNKQYTLLRSASISENRIDDIMLNITKTTRTIS